VASVAADPSAIAPPLSLPSRSDAAPPAGPSSAFADLLGAAATTPQPQAGSTARADDRPSTPQSGAILSSGNGSCEPAGTGAAPGSNGTGKNAPGNDPNDLATAFDPGAATLDVTLVAGLLLPPVPLPPSPDADQTPAAAQDPQGASADAAPAIGGDTSGKPDEHKDASASSDPVAAAIVAAVPLLIPVTVAGAAAASVSDVTSRIASSPVTALPSDTMFSAPGLGAPASSDDVANSGASAQQTDQTAQPIPKLPAAGQDALPAMPSLAATPPPSDALQIAAPPGALPTTASAGAADPSGSATSAAQPAAPPAAPSGPSTPLAAFTPFNPAPTPPPLVVESHPANQPTNAADTPHEAEGVATPLPAQVAVRVAPSVHADGDSTSDNETHVPWGSAGREVGTTTATNNSGPAGSVLPSFNSGLAMVQGVAAPPVAPAHATAIPDAVPLAGIPVAIVARAEAGERKFEIRLDPPDLGRIEVQLNVDSSGRATSHLIADRPDTLDLLRRDAPALERALQSAGLTTGDGALQFSLRDQSFAGRDQGAPAPVTPAIPAPAAESELAPIDMALRRYGAAMGLGGGIDIRV
jgi:flagellar hook-length control protein FliK